MDNFPKDFDVMKDFLPQDFDVKKLLNDEYNRLSSVINTTQSLKKKRKAQADMEYIRSVLDAKGIQE